jgi:fatty acid desaturase
MIQTEMMKRYGVQVPRVAAWIVSLIAGFALGIAYILLMLGFVFGTALVAGSMSSN